MQNIKMLRTNPKRWSMLLGMGKRSYGALAGLALLAAGSAQAQLTWEAGSTGGAGDGAGAWLTGNWWNGSSDQTWTSGSDAVFGHGGAGGAVTLGSATTANSITLSNFTGTYTLGSSGVMLTLNNGITLNSGAGATTINSPITLGGAQTWLVNSASGLTLSSKTTSPVTLNNSGYTWTVDGSGPTQWTSDQKGSTTVWISGAGGLTKNGSGTLMIIGNNNQAGGYTGTTTINGGVLRPYLDALGLGSGNLTINGGVYEHYWNGAFTRSLGSGAGQVQILGGVSGFSENGNTAATFTLNNSASYEVVWGAAGEAGNPSATGYFNPSTFVLQESTAQSGAALTLANKIDLNGTTRTIRSSGAGTSSGTISGVIRDSQNAGAGLTKTGVGALKLTAANTYPGNTTINAGILNVGVAETAGTSGPFGKQAATAAGTILFGGGTLQYSSANSFDYSGRFTTAGSQPISIDVNGQNVTFATAIQGAGTSLALTSSTGTGGLTLSATNTYDGTTTVNKGILTVNGSLASGSAVTVNSGGTLTGSGTINGSVTANNGATLTGSGAINGSVAATGAYISPAGAGAIGTLPLASGLTLNSTNKFICDLGTLSGSSDLIAITGDLVLNGTNYVAYSLPMGGAASNATYTIMTWTGSQTGSGTVVFPDGSTAMNGATLNLNANSVTITTGPNGITTGASIDFWTAGSSVWDLTSPNWKIGGVSGKTYASGDNVVFDDSGAGGTVTGNAYNPNSVTFSNTTAKSYTISAVINGPGALTNAGNGTVTLSGANTYTGGTVLNAGQIKISADNNLGATGAPGPGITFNGTATLSAGSITIARPITINNSALVTWTGNGLTTISGNVTGTGGMVASSTAFGSAFSLTGAGNTFQGPILIAYPSGSGGNQYGVKVSSLADSSAANGTIGFYGTSTYNTGIYFYWQGAGDLVLNNRYIYLGNSSAPANGDVILNNSPNGGSVIINTSLLVTNTGTLPLVLGGTSTGLNAFNGLITNGVSSTVSLTKKDACTWVLSGANTYSGATTVNGGALSLPWIDLAANANPLGRSPASASSLLLGNGATLQYTGPAASCDRAFTINGTAAGHAATLDASGTGPLNLTSAASAAYGTANQTRTLYLAGTNTGANTLAASIGDNGSGPVSLTKSGSGTWVLTGASTYTGATTVSNGTLLVNGSLSSATGGVLVKGGTLGGTGAITGALTVQSGGTLLVGTTNLDTLTVSGGVNLSGNTVFRIGKSASGTAQNQLQGSYTTAGGTLTVTNLTTDPSYALAPGDSFQLFQYGISGSFTNYNLPPLPFGLSWDKSGLATSGTLAVTDTPSTPVFTPPSGGYVGALTVTIASDLGTTIFYTMDGSTVVASASPATAVVPVNTASLTITAYATNIFGKVSAVASAAYSTVARPTWIDPNSVGYWTTQSSWSNNVVANGRDVTADFSALSLTADTTVYLDTPQTVGNLLFGDVGNTWGWTLADYGAGPLTLGGVNSTITVGNQTTTISAVLAGTNSIFKAGAGTLTLTNKSSTFTGGLTINDGVLVAAASTGGLNPAGSSLGAVNTPRAITVNPGATLAFGASDLFGNHRSTMNVALVVNSGAVVSNSIVCYNTLGPVTLNGGTLLRAVGNGGTWDSYSLKGDVTVGGTMASTITQSDTNGSVNLGAADVKGTRFDVADVTGDANPDLIVSAVLVDSPQTGAPYTPQASYLTKTGPGTMQLLATNTYTGTTTVSNGTLLVNGSISSTNGGVLVAGGTLGGNGTISGSVTVADGGNLAPGASVGTLSIGGNLDVSGMAAGTTGKLRYELGPISASDSLAVTGTLTLGTDLLGFSDFAFANVGGLQAGTYTLITSGGLSGTLNPADLAGTIGAFTGTLQITGNNLELVVTSGVASPPVVVLTSPTNSQQFVASASIPLTATVTDNGHTISQVNYYSGASLVGSSSTGPNYSAAWSGVAAGSYSLTAVAVYDTSLTVTSAPLVNIVVLGTPVLSSYGPRSGSSFPLTFSGPSGQTYKVLSSANVALPLSSWTVLTSGTFAGSAVSYTDTGATNAHQFYRIQSP